MDFKSLTAYPNASLTQTLPAIFIKPNPRTAFVIPQPHLYPNPNRPLQVQEKPLRTRQIGKPITPRKPKSSKTVSTNVPDVLRLMDGLKLQIGVDVYSELVEECTSCRDSIGAQALLDHIRKSRIRPPISLMNRLLLMNVECGLFEIARHVFEEMPVRDVSSYAVMIAASFDEGEYEEALEFFIGIVKRGFFVGEGEVPTWIIDCVLKACLHIMDFELGKQVHCFLVKVGYVSDLCIGSSLINFYGKCRCLEEAESVFDQLPCRDTVVWTAQIVNKCQEGNFDDAIYMFYEMSHEGVKMNHFTFSSVLRACGSASLLAWCGKQVHASIVKLGLTSNYYVQCGIIDMYTKRGLLSEARRVFEMFQDENNVACWNSMIVGYLDNGQHIEAMTLLYKMKDVGLQPRESLFTDVMIACGSNTLAPH